MKTIVNVLGHQFYACPKDLHWYALPGVYAFVKIMPTGVPVFYYVGETGSFADRFPQHEDWGNAQRLGATHVLALVVNDEPRRLRIEKELIGTLNPPLNEQHRTQPTPRGAFEPNFGLRLALQTIGVGKRLTPTPPLAASPAPPTPSAAPSPETLRMLAAMHRLLKR